MFKDDMCWCYDTFWIKQVMNFVNLEALTFMVEMVSDQCCDPNSFNIILNIYKKKKMKYRLSFLFVLLEHKFKHQWFSAHSEPFHRRSAPGAAAGPGLMGKCSCGRSSEPVPDQKGRPLWRPLIGRRRKGQQNRKISPKHDLDSVILFVFLPLWDGARDGTEAGGLTHHSWPRRVGSSAAPAR